MTAPRLTAAIFALAAALSVAEGGRPQGRAVAGRQITAQAQSDAEQDEIDSYLAASHHEKHIFRNPFPKKNNDQHMKIRQPVNPPQLQSQSQTSTKHDDRVSNTYDSSGQILNNGPVHNAQAQITAEQDEIDSYLAASHHEKHIFRPSLPKKNNGQHTKIRQPVNSPQLQSQSQTSTKHDDRVSNAYDSSGQIINNGPVHNGNNQKPLSHLLEANIPNKSTNEYDAHQQHGQNNFSDSVQPTTLQEQPVRYDGSQLWKITMDERSKLKVVGSILEHQGRAIWEGNRTIVDALIAANIITNVSEALRRSGIPYEVVITDLQRNIEEENPPLDEEQLELQKRKGHRMSWHRYHRVDDINGYLDYLAHTYPRMCSVQTIGQSYEGREIKLLKISNGRKNNKAVFIDGGIHAREWITPATVTYIINHIVENYDNGPDIYRQIDWYSVPVLNPDGYEFAHTTNRLWRKNRSGSGACKGVNINKNFGFKWGGKGTSNSPCSEVYRGSSAFSEPESKAFRDFFTSSDANFKLYVSYRSYGQFLLHPWGYKKAGTPDYLDLESAAKKAAYAIEKVDGTKYTVGASNLMLYASAGGSSDWVKAKGIKYSYTMELRDTGYYGFVLPAKYILKVGQESLQGLMVLAEIATGA